MHSVTGRYPVVPGRSQRLPADQSAPEREEGLVDVGPLVIPHPQAAKLTEQPNVRSTTLKGAKSLSRGSDVLVNDTAETIATQNASVTECRRRRV